MKAQILLALAALPISTARAAEPAGTLTLACQGTQTRWTAEGMKSEQVTMTLVVDFQKKTVVGFPGTDPPVNINNSDEMTISFSRDVGSSRFNGIIHRMRSTVDCCLVRYEPAGFWVCTEMQMIARWATGRYRVAESLPLSTTSHKIFCSRTGTAAIQSRCQSGISQLWGNQK